MKQRLVQFRTDEDLSWESMLFKLCKGEKDWHKTDFSTQMNISRFGRKCVSNGLIC